MLGKKREILAMASSSVTRLMPCFRLAGPMIAYWKKRDRFLFSGRQGGDEDRE